MHGLPNLKTGKESVQLRYAVSFDKEESGHKSEKVVDIFT